MKYFSTINSRLLLIILLVVFIFVAIIPPRTTQAVPVNCPLCDLWGVNISVQTTAETSAWTLKNFALNVAGVFIARTIITMLRDYIISAIATGQFGRPKFVASFFADPSRWGEYAARMAVSRLTGINFCNYNLNIPKAISVKIDLRIDFKCNVENFSALTDQLFLSPATISLVNELLMLDHDPLYDILRAEQKKKEAEALTRKAKKAEVQAGSGWLGTKGADGKIITPGILVADSLKGVVGSDYRQCDTATEFQQVIASCALAAVVDIVNAGAGKLIEGFLGQAFPPPSPR